MVTAIAEEDMAVIGLLVIQKLVSFGLNITLAMGEGCYVYQEHSNMVLEGSFFPHLTSGLNYSFLVFFYMFFYSTNMCQTLTICGALF